MLTSEHNSHENLKEGTKKTEKGNNHWRGVGRTHDMSACPRTCEIAAQGHSDPSDPSAPALSSREHSSVQGELEAAFIIPSGSAPPRPSQSLPHTLQATKASNAQAQTILVAPLSQAPAMSCAWSTNSRQLGAPLPHPSCRERGTQGKRG